jgi:ABC-type Fe3+-hydroxamate transport system substrate-binding protein
MPRAGTAPALGCVLAVLALAATGCGLKHEPTGGLGTTYPAQVVDATGARVTIPARPRRIVSLDPSGTRLLRRLGAPVEVLPPQAGGGTLVHAHPDLVILPAARYADAVGLARLVHAPAVVMPSTRLPAIEHAALVLGVAADRPEQGRQLALALARERSTVEGRVSRLARTPVFVDTGQGVPPAARSLIGALVAAAGGRMLAAGVERAYAPREIARLGPQAYVALASSGLTPARLRRGRATRTLAPVRDGRVLIVPDGQLVPDDRAYALLAPLLHLLHPDVAA